VVNEVAGALTSANNMDPKPSISARPLST
jgi:hypothetical protein